MLGLCALTPNDARGAVIEYISPQNSGAWFAAAGPQVRTVDFEMTGVHALGLNWLGSHGVWFSGAPGLPPHSLLAAYQTVPVQRWAAWYQYYNSDPTTAGMTMSFLTPQHAIGFNHPIWGGNSNTTVGWTGLEIEFSRGGVVVGGWNQDSPWGQTPGNSTNTFLGLTTDFEFDKARIWWNQPTDVSPFDSIAAITDLYFSTVPAPSVLLVFSLGGLLGPRRRRGAVSARSPAVGGGRVAGESGKVLCDIHGDFEIFQIACVTPASARWVAL